MEYAKKVLVVVVVAAVLVKLGFIAPGPRMPDFIAK